MFFNNNRLSNIAAVEVEEAVGYEGVMGAQIAMYEGVQNDYKLFTGALMGDFQEATMIHEGQSEESIYAFQEGVLGDMWAKIKEWVKKIWAKIKAIFNSFMAKFNSVFMKSSKSFIDKYKKEIANKNLSKMKAKYSAPKGGGGLVKSPSGKMTVSVDAGLSDTVETLRKKVEDFETEDTTLEMIKDLCGVNSSDLKSFAKDFHEECYEDEEEKEGFDDIKHTIISDLTNADKAETELKKWQTALEKSAASMLKEIDDMEKHNSKNLGKDVKDRKDDYQFRATMSRDLKSPNQKNGASTSAGDRSDNARDNAQVLLQLLRMTVGCYQTATSKISAAVMAEFKFGVSQARRLAAKMVAYSPKNEAVMMDAIEEAAYYEAMSELK